MGSLMIWGTFKPLGEEGDGKRGLQGWVGVSRFTAPSYEERVFDALAIDSSSLGVLFNSADSLRVNFLTGQLLAGEGWLKVNCMRLTAPGR